MIDVSDDIELKNGKGNPFGWSQYEKHHNDQRIGWIECGGVDITDKRYSHEIVDEGAQKRIIIYLNEQA